MEELRKLKVKDFLTQVFPFLKEKEDKFEWFYQYKLDSLIEHSEGLIHEDTELIKPFMLYSYCGHDGSSIINGYESMGQMMVDYEFYTEGKYFYFEAVPIVYGYIIKPMIYRG